MSRVIAIPGSLRRGSYNRLLVRAAADQPPAGMTIEIHDLDAIPLFNEDAEEPEPERVRALRDAVAAADGVLISTPEYNWGIPGVLKNAVDWLSRAPREVLAGKRVAIMGATPGSWGTRYAQAALRQVLTATESLVMPAPALFVKGASKVFDEHGALIDASTRKHLDALLAAFATWLER